MGDRILKFLLTWGLSAACLFFLGLAAAAYFAFTSVVLELLYGKLLRVDFEQRLVASGVTAQDVDRRMLPTDRGFAVGRAVVALAVAVLFYEFA